MGLAQNRIQHCLQNALFAGWLAVVVLPIVSFGGNRNWVWPWALVLCSICLVLALQTRGLQHRLTQLRLDPWLGPKRAPLVYLALAWWLTSALYVLPIGLNVGPFTRDTGAALLAFAQACFCVQLFLLTVLIFDSKTKIKRAVLALFIIAVLHASIATGLHLTGVRVIEQYWAFNPVSASGFFYNRNHFAGYLEIHLGLGIGLLVSGLRLSTDDERSWKQMLRDWLAIIMSAKAQIRIALIVLVIALVVTQSRMGNIAFFSAVISVGILAMFVMHRRPKVLPWFLLSLVLIDLIVIGGWFGADRLAERIVGVQLDRTVLQSTAPESPDTGLSPSAAISLPTDASVAANPVDLERERPILTRETLKMWLQAPAFGVGPGGFRSNFPVQRSNDMSALFYDHAHNDVAQLLAERGAAGFLVFAGMLGCCIAAAISALASRQSRFLSGLAFGALVSIFAIVFHSFADFNLRIAGNVSLFTVVLAFAWLAKFSNDARPKDKAMPERRASKRPQRTQPYAVAQVLAAIALILGANVALPVAAYAQSNANVLQCELGQAEIGANFPTLAALRELVNAKKLRLKALAAAGDSVELDKARDELLGVTLQTIEAALAWQSIERMDVARGYWSVAQKDLGDTHWRLRQQAKKVGMRALWLAEDLAHAEKTSLSSEDCKVLARATGLQTAGFLYRAAICTQDTDPALATDLMQRSADAGHPSAAEIVGRLCYEKADRICTVKRFCQAVDAGRLQTAGLAAFLITETPPTPALAVKASALFEIAANSGDFASANNLGELYEQGYIGRPNYVQAELWYQKAAERQIVAAQLNIAKLISRDPRRKVEAERWLELAEQLEPNLAKQLRKQLNGDQQ